MSAPDTRASTAMAAELAVLREQVQNQAADYNRLSTLFERQNEATASLQQRVTTAEAAALEAQVLAETATNLANVDTPTAPTAAAFAELQALVTTNAATAARGLAETQTATAQAATAPLPSYVTPLRGGMLSIPGKLSIAWTGGGLSDTASNRDKAATPYAFRPQSLKEMSSTYMHNTAGLPTEKCLDTDPTSTVTLMGWKNNVYKHLVKNGQDGVFLLHHDGVEMPLVANSGRFSSANGKTHVNTLLASGDEFDAHNLATSGEFLLDSIGPALLSSIQTLMPENEPASAMGPFIFLLIVERIMMSTSSLWRDMITKLGSMRLTTEPGENVATFADKLKNICSALEGAGQIPTDISFLICRSIKKCSVKVFESHYTALYATLQFNPTARTWHSILVEAVGLYNALLQDKEWTVDEPVPPRSLAALVPRPTGPSAEDRTCHLCGVAGHLSRNCPGTQGKRSGRQNRLDRPMPAWKTTGPAQGEPGKMTKFNNNYLWCSTCSHWNVTHSTENHQVGLGKRDVTTPPTPTPPVAAIAAPTVAAVAAPPVTLIPAPFNLATFGLKCSLVYGDDDNQDANDANDSYDYSDSDDDNSFNLDTWDRDPSLKD